MNSSIKILYLMDFFKEVGKKVAGVVVDTGKAVE